MMNFAERRPYGNVRSSQHLMQKSSFFNTQILVFNAQFLVFNTTFIIFAQDIKGVATIPSI